MRTVSENDAVITLPSIIDELGSESVAIERDGKDVAVLISPLEYESIRQMKIKRLMESMDRIATSVQSSVKDETELEELMRSLDRKAT